KRRRLSTPSGASPNPWGLTRRPWNGLSCLSVSRSAAMAAPRGGVSNTPWTGRTGARWCGWRGLRNDLWTGDFYPAGGLSRPLWDRHLGCADGRRRGVECAQFLGAGFGHAACREGSAPALSYVGDIGEIAARRLGDHAGPS